MQGLSDDKPISLITVAADFGLTLLFDGNRDTHDTVKRSAFVGRR